MYMVARLKENVPENVKRVLRCLNDDYDMFYREENCKSGDDSWESEVHAKESHPLFNTGRWILLETDFDDVIYDRGLSQAGSGRVDVLKVRGRFKIYDDEIEKFVDWMRPYLDHEPGDMIGITEYDDDVWHRGLYF